MSDLYFVRANGASLKLCAATVFALRGYEQHGRGDLEAGGLLVGRHHGASDAFLVDAITTPQPEDECSRFGFSLNGLAHQAAVDALWKASDLTAGLLGAWHTHPEPRPTPSTIDLDDWARRLAHDVTDIEVLFFVIVGQTEIAVWEGDRCTGAIARLTARRALAA